MSDPVLHIKDSYFFEVPKVLYPYDFGGRRQFPGVWIRLDNEFQDWEFERLYHALSAMSVGLPPEESLMHQWHEWRDHDHNNFAKPFDVFLEEKYQAQLAKFHTWKAAEVQSARAKNDGTVETAQRLVFDDYLNHVRDDKSTNAELLGFFGWRNESPASWRKARNEAKDVQAWKADEKVPEWSKQKLAAYNANLSGKILLEPQPFGTLRNLHEADTTIIDPQTGWINSDNFGFCISKFMIIEVAVGLVLLLLFSWLSSRLSSRRPPKGKLWNLLEVFFVFIRDQVARPALDGGHDDHDGGHEHADHGHAEPAHAAHADHGHAPAKPVHHARASDAYVPVLCTIFFFILGCNLAGMIPWMGAPTGTWAVTLVLAIVTLGAGFIGGVYQFGLAGYFLNQIPSMDLSWPIAMVLKPIIFVIELGGLLIKHAVLSVRLLANMMAGHMVLLAIMGIAFGSTAAFGFMQAGNTIDPMWWVAATASIVGCTLLSLLELFVAFLQAYVFTLLSALFIGAAIHKH